MSLPYTRIAKKIELDQKCRITRHRTFQLAQTDAPTLPGWVVAVAIIGLCLLLGVIR